MMGANTLVRLYVSGQRILSHGKTYIHTWQDITCASVGNAMKWDPQ